MRIRARDESDLTDGRGQECRKGVRRGGYIYKAELMHTFQINLRNKAATMVCVREREKSNWRT